MAPMIGAGWQYPNRVHLHIHSIAVCLQCQCRVAVPSSGAAAVLPWVCRGGSCVAMLASIVQHMTRMVIPFIWLMALPSSRYRQQQRSGAAVRTCRCSSHGTRGRFVPAGGQAWPATWALPRRRLSPPVRTSAMPHMCPPSQLSDISRCPCSSRPPDLSPHPPWLRHAGVRHCMAQLTAQRAAGRVYGGGHPRVVLRHALVGAVADRPAGELS